MNIQEFEDLKALVKAWILDADSAIATGYYRAPLLEAKFITDHITLKENKT